MIVLPVKERRAYTGGAQPARHLHARKAGANDDDMLFLIGFSHGRHKLSGKSVIAFSRNYV